MGRPTALTPGVQAQFVKAISAGNYYEAACAYAGIGYNTFCQWMKWGKTGDKDRALYREFRGAVLKAEADAEVRIVAQWQQQIPDNWPAARDFLGRRFPERWGPKEKIEHSGPGGKEIVFRVTYGDAGEAGANRDSDSAAQTARQASGIQGLPCT